MLFIVEKIRDKAFDYSNTEDVWMIVSEVIVRFD